ncbi:MAG: proline dehydrogenase family protein [Actinomycetota bacterium]|nr:proline dehydrogenase family protein [Actinomycetota bacterium]
MASAVGRALLAVTSTPTVRRLFTERRLGRRLAMRFVAGETLDEAVTVARRLNRRGMSVSLDHLGEHVADAQMADRARRGYLACLDRIGEEGLDANISVKLTQLGLGLDEALVEQAVEELGKKSAELGTTLTIDMEESRYTEATVDLFCRMQPLLGNLGVALQAYLYRTEEDMVRLIPLGGHIRLCKGAYAEPPDVAYQRKQEVDRSFARLLQQLMDAEDTLPAVATHDGSLIDLAKDLALARREPFEFQMLYGVRNRLQAQLVEEGHSLRIYLPYGAEWYPYLTRRLAERPANLLFFLRAVAGR